jgi:hypothetical protein
MPSQSYCTTTLLRKNQGTIMNCIVSVPILQGLYIYPHFVSAKIPISSGCLTSITCIRNFWTSLAPYLDLKSHYATFSPNISQQASRKWVAVKLFHHYLKAINLFGVGYPPCMDLPIQSNPSLISLVICMQSHTPMFSHNLVYISTYLHIT